jgi:hypothetical protein
MIDKSAANLMSSTRLSPSTTANMKDEAVPERSVTEQFDSLAFEAIVSVSSDLNLARMSVQRAPASPATRVATLPVHRCRRSGACFAERTRYRAAQRTAHAVSPTHPSFACSSAARPRR